MNILEEIGAFLEDEKKGIFLPVGKCYNENKNIHF